MEIVKNSCFEGKAIGRAVWKVLLFIYLSSITNGCSRAFPETKGRNQTIDIDNMLKYSNAFLEHVHIFFANMKKNLGSQMTWTLNRRYFTMNSTKFKLNKYLSSSFLDFLYWFVLIQDSISRCLLINLHSKSNWKIQVTIFQQLRLLIFHCHEGLSFALKNFCTISGDPSENRYNEVWQFHCVPFLDAYALGIHFCKHSLKCNSFFCFTKG